MPFNGFADHSSFVYELLTQLRQEDWEQPTHTPSRTHTQMFALTITWISYRSFSWIAFSSH